MELNKILTATEQAHDIMRLHYIENYSRIDENCCCDTLEKYEINEENLKYLTVLIDDIFNMIRIPNWRNHFWLS